MEYPAAIELAIWLNQHRVGAISITDAINAVETITQSTHVETPTGYTSWSDLVRSMPFSPMPYYAVLPTPGNTFGLDSQSYSSFELSAGICAINSKILLGQKIQSQSIWQIKPATTSITIPDARSAREILNALIESATSELGAADVSGDRDQVEQELHQLRPIHLPPALPNRAKVDLELAQRIWLIAQFGITDTQVHDSPSTDEVRIATFSRLRSAALELMAASTAVA